MEAPTTAGTYAQYAVVSESILGVKPESISAKAKGRNTEIPGGELRSVALFLAASCS